jgi:hypothetical protein
MTALPACADMPTLFEATDPDSHAEARAICLRCPLLDKCRTMRIDDYDGTLGGRLFKNGKEQAVRVKESRTVTCLMCGNEFTTKSRASLCSPYCRSERTRQLWRLKHEKRTA